MAKVDLNKVILVGNLTKDPEGGVSGNDKAYLNFNMANNQKNGTNFFDVVVFGGLAEICGKYLKKGRQVIVEGKLRQNKWKDKTGTMKYKIDIIGENVQFLGGSNSELGSNTSQEPYIDEQGEEIPY